MIFSVKKIVSNSKGFPFLVFFFLFSIYSFQNAFGQNLDSLMGIQAKADPHEKLYFHFDKSYYSPGELIYYKAYVFRGMFLNTSSKNLYIELIGENGKVLRKMNAPILHAQAVGNIPLGFDYMGEYLLVRAYTISMLNGDTSFLYTKTLPIILPTDNKKLGKENSPLVPETKTITKTSQDPGSETIMRFYPEGGDLVENLLSIVAFKITDKNGTPFKTNGQIINEKGESITNFAVEHDGMGAFTLTPAPNERYFAVWTDSKGQTQKTKLPFARSKSALLRVLSVPNGKRFTLIRSDDAPDTYKTLYVVGYMNQRLVYQAKANLSQESGTVGVIPTQNLPTGILQITILDAQLRPIAERISFVNNEDYSFPAEIQFLKPNKNKRGFNEVVIQVPGNPAADFSVSVTDADLNLTSPYEDNLISHVFLTGDLRGKVINPNFYFKNKSDSITRYLDYVMLTHGWRRYNWELLFRGRALEGSEKESNYLTLNGKITGLQNPKSYEGIKLNFILKTRDSSNDFLSAPLNNKGELSLDGLIFYGFGKLSFQPHLARLSFDPSQLYINNGLYISPNQALINPEARYFTRITDPVVYQKYSQNASQQQAVNYSRSNSTVNLKEVVVKEKAVSNAEKLDKKYATGIFSSSDARSFDVSNDPFAQGALNVFQYLQSRVPGLTISNTGGTSTPTLSWRGATPTLYLDGSKTDADLLTSINMNNIAYVKVFDPGSSGILSTSGGGAIAIFTKRGGDDKELYPGMVSLNLSGYSPYKEFSGPDYATGLNDNLPDFRSTLYWNPNLIILTGKHSTHFSFYNSDVTRHFRIIAEGVNAENKLVHIEKVY